MGRIINNIGMGAYNTYKYAAESAGKIAREIKLKGQMASNKSQIRDLYEDIGKNVYEKYLLKEKIDIDADFATDCSMIDVLAGEIEEMRMEILSLKELKQCPKCNYEIGLDYHYCPNCGYEQDLTEEAMKNDGPATIETTDNIDKTLKKKNNSNNEHTNKENNESKKNNMNKEGYRDKSNDENKVDYEDSNIDEDYDITEDDTINENDIENEEDDE